ncbi:MAG: hypothetical protein Fur0018_28330 [Anaerolineales bacterium]
MKACYNVSMTHSPTLDAFAAHLRSLDRSPSTIRGYLSDLRAFARWYAGTFGEAFVPAHLTPTDVREYRQYLLTLGRQPATVNRKLAALRALAEWQGIPLEVRGLGGSPSRPAGCGRRGSHEQRLVVLR